MYYFASDVHLGAGDESTSRRTERRFVAWLDMVGKDAEEIFLVGDIFEDSEFYRISKKEAKSIFDNMVNKVKW